ncbi:MAG TPA: carbohydrate kinase family protein, partial [Candidatus Dormibacteraeota bacterium]
GLVAGLLRGLDVPTAGAVASLAATYAVEQVGTIEHRYSGEEFSERFREAFGIALPSKFWPAG